MKTCKIWQHSYVLSPYENIAEMAARLHLWYTLTNMKNTNNKLQIATHTVYSTSFQKKLEYCTAQKQTWFA